MNRNVMKMGWKLIAMFALALVLALGGMLWPETATVAKAENPALTVPEGIEQTGENEYTIWSATGWDNFCDLLAENDKGIFDGKTVKLGKSITVSRMAGNNNHDFTGIFDGQSNKGYTLTFTATATDNYLAPFRNVLGQSENAHAVIRNLNVVTTITATDCRHMAGLIAVVWGYVDVTNCHVTVNINSTTGSNNSTDLYPSGLASQVVSSAYLSVSGCTVDGAITTDGKYAAGYIGIVQGSAGIANSTSSVTINSSVNGDGTHGGFVGAQSNTLTLENCVFNGCLLGSSTHSCGGFVGWRNGTVNITNCIFDPSDTCTIGDNDSYTFSRRSGTVSNSYYTVPFGEAQGEFIGQLTLPEGVTALAAEGNTVSYDKKTWYIAGKTVILTVSPPDGCALAENGLAVSYPDAEGETQHIELTQGEGDNAGKWTFTMPSANVTATAAFTYVTPVDYVERSWNGTAVVSANQTRSDVAPVLSDGQMTEGWYYLGSDVTVDGRVSLTGDTHLILGDGYTLNTEGLYIPQGSTLTIYGQSDGAGAGKIDSHPSSGAGIGGYSGHRNGNIEIHGGTVMATGGSGGAGIGGSNGNNGGTITIYGGSVTAIGGSDSAGIGGGYCGNGGTITIYGGTITANGPSDSDCNENGAGIGGGDRGDGGTITICGGTITTYSRDGAGIGGGDDGDGGTITIHGGTITSTKVNQGQGARIGGGNDAAPGTIIIDGGTVTTAGGKGAGIGGGKGNRTGGSVTITGGVINATGSYGIGSGEDGSDVAVTLSLSGENDSVTASSYNGAVTVAEGCSLKDNEENLYYGVITDDGLASIAGKALVKGPAGYAVFVADTLNGTVIADPGFAQANTVIALTVTPDERCTLKSLTVTQGETPVDVDENNSFTMPAGNVTVTAIFAKRYMYLDSNGAVQYAIATPLTGETNSITGWYAVEGNVTIEDRLLVLDAHLILCDGCTLNAENGIDVSAGNSLAIYAQSAGGNMGVLNATAGVDDGSAGIGGGYEPSGGTITINGGKITANGGKNGAGIGGGYGGGCGSITINGGDITARGGSSSGDHGSACIGGGSGGTGGSITINGGTITALGNNWRVWGIGNGYQGSDVTVKINGGNILAEGGYYSEHGIDGTITLSYTNAADSITVSAFQGTVTVAEGKTFKDESGNIYTSETLSDTFGTLTNATLTPASVYSVNVGECRNGSVTAQEMVFEGETVTLTVNPAEGYALLANGLTVSYIDAQGQTQSVELTQGEGENADIWTFTMPSANVTATAEFVRTATSWAELQAAFNAGGTVMLTQDISAGAGDSYLTVPIEKTVTLDLNGKTLSRGLTESVADGYVIRVNGNLTVTDSDTGGRITGNSNLSDIVWVDPESSFSMNSGIIDGSGLSLGAIYSYYGAVHLSGTPVINGGVRFFQGLSRLLMIDGPLSNTVSIAVGLNPYAASDPELYPYALTTGWSEKMGSADPADYFTSAEPTCIVRRNASGEAELVSFLTFGTPNFTLPAGVGTIEANAFEGVASMRIVDASNCTEIGAEAFMGSGLTQIKLPYNCEIHTDAFKNLEKVYVFAPAGGKTETFCNTHDNVELVSNGMTILESTTTGEGTTYQFPTGTPISDVGNLLP